MLLIYTLILIYMYRCFSWMYVCAPGACLVPIGSLGCMSVHQVHAWCLLDPLELEFQKVVSLRAGTGNQNLVLWKNSRCSDLLSISPAWDVANLKVPVRAEYMACDQECFLLIQKTWFSSQHPQYSQQHLRIFSSIYIASPSFLLELELKVICSL